MFFLHIPFYHYKSLIFPLNFSALFFLFTLLRNRHIYIYCTGNSSPNEYAGERFAHRFVGLFCR